MMVCHGNVRIGPKNAEHNEFKKIMKTIFLNQNQKLMWQQINLINTARF